MEFELSSRDVKEVRSNALKNKGSDNCPSSSGKPLTIFIG
ncbi:hypothetical protein JCM19239_651 [Vibrio variabilis]|uniref:Uncharacterized protein n=1 Tax=Vibrio variabilis TaxID=990271 RepID=A0ABQ0JMM3_9VIBR|nr:hypothetical protein JCM19239_651 [Vibrio variabilis]